MFRRRSKRRAGIQLLDNHAKIAVVENAGRKLRVRQQELVKLESGSMKNGKIENEASVIDRLQEIISAMKLRDMDVTLAVPASSAVMRRAVYPALRDGELRNMIEVDLLSREQLPFKDPVFDFIRLGPPARDQVAAAADANPKKKGRPEEEVLIFTTPVDIVDSYVRVASAAGLKPKAVELAPLALFRLLITARLDSGPDDLPENFLLIHAESDHADLCIFENGIPVFMRQQSMPIQHMLDTDADRVSGYGRNLAIEVSRILNYYKYSISAEQQDIQDLIICSELDWLSALSDQISSSYGGRVQSLQLESVIVNYEPQHQAYTVPIGLAMKGW